MALASATIVLISSKEAMDRYGDKYFTMLQFIVGGAIGYATQGVMASNREANYRVKKLTESLKNVESLNDSEPNNDNG